MIDATAIMTVPSIGGLAPLAPNAISVLEKRILNTVDGVMETPDEMYWRTAKFLGFQNKKYGWTDQMCYDVSVQFYVAMRSGDFHPNSPTLANADARTGQLAACFVLKVPDKLEGILQAAVDAAMIHRTGGGTGFSFSLLRPENDPCHTNGGTASGPNSFMLMFDAITGAIKQGGLRRGANMGILRVDHPDIMSRPELKDHVGFIDIKQDTSKLNNFNISVAVTDAFMRAVALGGQYELFNPKDGSVVGTLDARTVFKRIVLKAWETGEPGVVFIDKMNNYCPVPWLGQYEATNPCGEQPLIADESCNLGSINIERYIELDPKGKPYINWVRLRETIHLTTLLLNNVIDGNKYPLPQLEHMAHQTLKIGLGVMGWARALFKLGVAYGSDESFMMAEQVMSFIDYESKMKSVELAKERGQFPARNGHEQESNAIYRRWCEERAQGKHVHPGADYMKLARLIEVHGIRNSTTTTVAPTGTISIFADTSGGCEPVYGLAMTRNQAGMTMMDADKVFRAALERELPVETVTKVLELVEAHNGSLVELMDDEACYSFIPGHTWEVLERLSKVFVVAHDCTPEDHVYMQAAFQAYNDSATSKTINFPESASIEHVERSYMLAYELGCKGITVYRNNSRQFQPLEVTKKVEQAPSEEVISDCPSGKCAL